MMFVTGGALLDMIFTGYFHTLVMNMVKGRW